MARKPDLERRAAIARAALALVLDEGVQGTSMSALADRVGMKRSTLYWYFGDLGEVFDAAMDAGIAEVQEFVARRLAGVEHPLDVLDTTVQAFVDYHLERPDHLLAMFQLWAVARSSDPEHVLARGRAFLEPLRASLVGVVRAGVAAGRVAPCDPDGVVEMTLAVIDGAQVQRITRDADARPLLDTYRSCVLAPLRVAQRRSA